MRKQYVLIILALIFLFQENISFGQVVISEIISPNQVELHNPSSDTVDVDEFWLCNRPVYERIGSLNAECGNFQMPPGGFLVVSTTQIELSREGDELGVYNSGNYSDPASILDYVIWGNRDGLRREDVAVAAGIWTEGDRASAYTEEQSLLYDGDGDASSDYYLGTSNQCEENIRCEVAGGVLALSTGGTSIEICAGDSIPDPLDVVIDSAVGSNMAWVITDTTGVILGLPAAPPFDLDTSGAGVCQIWHLSFEDSLTGVALGNNVADVMGCFALSNAITVTRNVGDDCPLPPCDVEGGSISFQDTLTEVTICIDDPESEDIVVSLTNASGTNSAWVVTDTNLNILAIDTSNVFNFDSAGAGVCLIWHLSFEDGLSGAAIDSNAAELIGCFSLSNAIKVTRLAGEDCPGTACEAVGGTLVIEGGATSIDICVGDGISDAFDIELEGAQGDNSAWVVTDTSGSILALPTSPPFDFEGLGAGNCLIYHLSFDGLIFGVSLDANINGIEGCFALSNSISVNRVSGNDCPGAVCEVDGGVIALGVSTTFTTFCVDDENPDTVTVNLSSPVGPNSAWIVTDTNMVIQSIDTSNVFVFDSSSAGTCFIWHLSFEDGLTGAEVDSNAANLEGCFDLSNPITVTKQAGDECPPPPCEINGGTIMTIDSLTSVSICIDDDVADGVEVSLSGATGTNNVWVVTDTNLNIISIDTSNVFNFDSAGAGVCLIWHLSFEDGLTGAEVDSSANDLMGCFSLSNAIRVTRLTGADCPPPPCVIEAGVIANTDTSTEVTFCVDDGQQDELSVNLDGGTGSGGLWLVTDTALNIIAIDTNNIFNFEGTSAGTCLIWHVSFEGELSGAEIGANAADISGCLALSNAIQVTKQAGADCPGPPCEVASGNLTVTGGADNVVVCGGSGTGSTISVELTGVVGARSAWVITDTLGMILGFPLAPPFNLTGARPGIYQIWHLSYDGVIIGASLGANINNIEGCVGLSNPIIVNRQDISSGSITFSDGSLAKTICVGDGQADELTAIRTEGEAPGFIWVITDPEGMILAVPDTFPFDFEGAGPGTCLIWMISDGGDVSGVEVGADLNELQGCIGISNSLTVERQEVNGGIITTPIGGTQALFCVGDGTEDILDLNLSGAIGSESAFLVTDSSGTIIALSSSLDINFDLLPPGECQVWHISFNDSLSGFEVGMPVAALTGCYSLSNAVNVIKVTGEDCPPPCTAVGGTLTGNNGSSEITICVDDNLSDTFRLNVTGASGANFAFLVSDLDGNIIGLNEVFSADLEGTGEGNLEVRHISYSDDAEIPPIGGNINTLFGCYSLSNVFTINRVIEEGCSGVCVAQGGTLSTEDGTEFTFCTDDGEADEITVEIEGNIGDSSVFVITNGAARIIRLTSSATIDFEGTGSGTCILSSISFTGSLTGLDVGMNTSEITGCFEFSNPITINKQIGIDCPGFCLTDGGSIMSIEGDTELSFCAGEVMFTITHDSEGADTTATYFYVVTDTAGVITEWRNSADGGDYDMSQSPGGVCRIYGYDAPNDSLLRVGANIADIAFECAKLSSNYVTIDKMVDGVCAEGCHTPRDIRFRSIGRDKWALTWDRVNDATGYVLNVGFEGVPGSFSQVPANRNRINLTGPRGRVIVFSVAAVCGANERSEFSREIALRLDENIGSPISVGRSGVINHGTVLPNGIIITEQAVAFPNPASDQINIWYDGQGIEGSVSIFDQTGRRVMSQQINGTDEFHQLDIQSLSDGLYFIIVESEGMLLMQDKLVKSAR